MNEPRAGDAANGPDLVPAGIAPDRATAELLREALRLQHIASSLPEALAGPGEAGIETEPVTVLVSRGDYDRATEAIIDAHLTGSRRVCAGCGYDLTGIETISRCPECGSEYLAWSFLPMQVWVAPRPVTPTRVSRAWMGLAIAALLALMTLVLALAARVSR